MSRTSGSGPVAFVAAGPATPDALSSVAAERTGSREIPVAATAGCGSPGTGGLPP